MHIWLVAIIDLLTLHVAPTGFSINWFISRCVCNHGILRCPHFSDMYNTMSTACDVVRCQCTIERVIETLLFPTILPCNLIFGWIRRM